MDNTLRPCADIGTVNVLDKCILWRSERRFRLRGAQPISELRYIHEIVLSVLEVRSRSQGITIAVIDSELRDLLMIGIEQR